MTDTEPQSSSQGMLSREVYYEYEIPLEINFVDAAILDHLLTLNFDVRTPESLHTVTLPNLKRDIEGFAVREEVTLRTIRGRNLDR